MLESLKHEDLQFQELTPEEKQSRGILARLTGPIASFTKGTRNGRKYSDKLWEKAFDAPLVKEMFKNGGLPGELQHPEGRSETDPTKIAIMMPEPPKKDAKGHLVASVDILDTPCGQIAYQLGKYGFKFGISSRGEGDLIQDFSGEESVDPDTYTLNAFDLVLIPACEDARLQFNESLETKPTNNLRVILSEALKNATDVDRKIMEEALDELNIDDNWRYVETYEDNDIFFEPGTKKYIVGDLDSYAVLNSLKNAKEYIDRYNPDGQFFKESLLKEGGYEIEYYLSKPFEDGWDFSLSGHKSHENFNTIEELQQALKDNGLPASLAEFDRANFDKDNGYIRTDYQHWHAFAYPPATYDNWSEDGPIVNIVEGVLNEEQVDREETKPATSVSEILKNKPQPEKPIQKDEPDVNVTVQVPEKDIEEDVEHREDDEPEREKWDTDFHRLDVAYNHNFKQFDDMEVDAGVIRDFTDDLEAQGKEYDIYKHTSDPGCTVFFQESLSLNEGKEYTLTFHDGPTGNLRKTLDVYAENSNEALSKGYEYARNNDLTSQGYTDITCQEKSPDDELCCYGAEVEARDGFGNLRTEYLFFLANNESDVEDFIYSKVIGKLTLDPNGHIITDENNWGKNAAVVEEVRSVYEATGITGINVYNDDMKYTTLSEDIKVVEAISWEDLNSTEQSAAETALVEMKNGSTIEDAVHGAVTMYNEENTNSDYEDEDFYMEEADYQKVLDYVKGHGEMTEGAVTPKREINLVAKPYNMTMKFGDEETPIESAVVVIPGAIKYDDGTVTDGSVACEDPNTGEVINFKTVEEAQDWIDNFGSDCLYRIDNGVLHATPKQLYDINRYKLDEDKYTRDELFDKFGTDDLDIINAGNEEVVELAADDDGALVEQLQKILKYNKSLEEQVKKLQEKISVGYAKEIELKEELDSYKQKVTKLSEKTREIKVLNEKLSKAENKLEESLKTTADNVSTLNESIKSKEQSNKKLEKNIANLNEAIDKKNIKIRSLNEEINKYKAEIDSKNTDIEQLKEQYETGQKDLEQLKNQYSKKLEKQNQIIEKYQRVAKNSVKRYIESQAVRLGVKSDEIINRLPKNYSFNDIDMICEDLQEYKFNMSNLPFGQYGLNEGIKVTAKNISKAPVENPADEITDYDLKIAEAFL